MTANSKILAALSLLATGVALGTDLISYWIAIAILVLVCAAVFVASKKEFERESKSD